MFGSKNIFNFLKKNKIPRNAPNFLIIGAQKAGTTALFEYLSLHPNLEPSKVKEIHFFSSNVNYNKGLDYYHSFFNQTVNNKKKFEASPSYLASPDAPERIYKYNKNLKLIILLRNPIDRAFSAWNMYRNRYTQNINWLFDDWLNAFATEEEKNSIVRRDKNKIFDFNAYIKEEIEFEKKQFIGKKIESPILLQGKYINYIQKYNKYFDRKNIYIIDNQDFDQDPINILKSLEEFLNLPSHNWCQEKINKIFVGNYSSQIDKESKEILTTYYKNFNYELSQFLQKELLW